MQTTVTAEAYQRLSRLHEIKAEILLHPESFYPAAQDLINNDIAELEGLLFEENEKATGHGDFDVIALGKILITIIPASERDSKEVQAGA